MLICTNFRVCTVVNFVRHSVSRLQCFGNDFPRSACVQLWPSCKIDVYYLYSFRHGLFQRRNKVIFVIKLTSKKLAFSKKKKILYILVTGLADIYHTHSRFTCFEKAVLLTRFFLSGSFMFCWLKQIKGLSANEKPLFLRRSAKKKKKCSKRTAEKNCFFGICKPASNIHLQLYQESKF